MMALRLHDNSTRMVGDRLVGKLATLLLGRLRLASENLAKVANFKVSAVFVCHVIHQRSTLITWALMAA